MRRLAEVAREKAMEVKRCQARFACDAVEREVAAQVAVNQSDGAIESSPDLVARRRANGGQPRDARLDVRVQRDEPLRNRGDRFFQREVVPQVFPGGEDGAAQLVVE